MTDTRHAVMEALRELCPNDEVRARLTEDTELMESGALDSFAVVRLIQFVEERFGVRIPDSDIGPALFASAATISDYVDRIGQPGAAPAAAVARADA